VGVLRCAPDGPPLDGERAALDLIGDAMSRDAPLIVVPVQRVGEEYFRLREAGRQGGDAVQPQLPGV
jgi:hypothetical protein